MLSLFFCMGVKHGRQAILLKINSRYLLIVMGKKQAEKKLNLK